MFRKVIKIGEAMLVLLVTAWLSNGVGASSTERQEVIRRTLLETGQLITQDLATGQKHFYQIVVPSMYYFRLTIHPVNFNLRLAIYDPNGHLCRKGRNRPFGPTSLSWIASSAGSYLIEVYTSEGSDKSGKYEIRLDEKREVGTKDETRIASEMVVGEAELRSDKESAEASRQAVEKYKQALAGFHELDDRREEGVTLISAGSVLYYSGDYHQALKFFNQALQIWQSLNDYEGQAESYYHIAHIYGDWGNFRLAWDSYEQALNLWRSLGNLSGQARCYTTLAVISIQLGEAKQALDLYRQSLEINRHIHDVIEEVKALNGLGYAYYEIGDDWNAIDSASQALQIAEKIGALVFQKVAHTTIGQSYTRLGDTRRAVTHATRGLELSRMIGDPRLEAYALKQLGGIYEVRNERAKALSHYEHALKINREMQNRQQVASLLNSIGFIHELNGDSQKALACYLEALSSSRETENPAEEIRSLHNIARVRRDLGSLAEARAHIEQAIKLIESLRVRVDSRQLRESYFATVQKSYGLYVDVLMLLHKQRPTDGLNEIALQISEQARARSLREMLIEARADLRKDVPPHLFERERTLQKDLNRKATEQQNLLSGAHSPEDAERLARELRSLKLEYEVLERQIRESAPRYAALTQPQPLTAKDIQQHLLDENTALLEYMLGDDRSYLWLVTQQKIFSYELPSRSVIEKAARRAYELLVMRQSLKLSRPEEFEQRLLRIKRGEKQYWAEAKALSRILLSPVAAELNQSRLIVVGDGALQYLPFGALPFSIPPGNKGTGKLPGPVNLLIDKYEIINLPSAATLLELREETANRQPAPKTIAVIANPVFSADDSRFALARRREDKTVQTPAHTSELLRAWKSGAGESAIPALPSSEIEGSEIIKLAPPGSSLLAMGFDANRLLVESQRLGEYRFLHFATHGLLNSENPELSGLILSLYNPNGEAVDGFLRMHEIYNMKLPADLVVLSACQTGIGKEIKGEGVGGGTRGFMYAGAPRVIASLWKVDDAATAALMQNFYRCLLQEKLSPSAALRQAQLKTMQQNRHWRSPYYWAAFVLQGEYR